MEASVAWRCCLRRCVITSYSIHYTKLYESLKSSKMRNARLSFCRKITIYICSPTTYENYWAQIQKFRFNLSFIFPGRARMPGIAARRAVGDITADGSNVADLLGSKIARGFLQGRRPLGQDRRGIRGVATPPSVSMPRVRGVTSRT